MTANLNSCTRVPKPELLTTSQLAYQLGMSESFLEKRRSWKMDPPYIKIGGRVFYRQEEIDAWLLSQTCKPQGGEHV